MLSSARYTLQLLEQRADLLEELAELARTGARLDHNEEEEEETPI